jgi:two-component system phosphate regulon sensor histidine kinase PhoR
MVKRRIFWQIYPGLLAVALLAVGLFFASLTFALNRFQIHRAEAQLETMVRLAAEQVSAPFDRDDRVELERAAGRLGALSSARVTLILPDGTVAGESDKSHLRMENHLDRPEIRIALESGGTGQAVRYSQSVRKSMLYVARPVFSGNRAVGVVRMALPMTTLEETVRGLEHALLAGAIAILLLAAGFSWFLSLRIAGPIERIREGAERFATGDFTRRLSANGSVETAALADTMNRMAGQLEERLQTLGEERNRREAILSGMVEGVLAVDEEGRLISLNRAAAGFFGVPDPEKARGRSLEEVFRSATLQQFIARVRESGEAMECELSVPGSPSCDLQARGAPLFDDQNRRIGVVAVFNDVTRLRRLEVLRRDFVANVSHELKTPVTAIRGFVETLLDGAIKEPAESERFLRIVARQAARLDALLEDLLLLSRLEQEHGAELERSPTVLAEILGEAMEVCSKRAEGKRIALNLECPEGLTADVHAPLVEQALINLIDNAVKYSPEGRSVTVRAAAEPGGVRLSVEDHGYGIEERHLERLFERFYRVDKGRSRQEGGTGLGLAIVKHIAQAHGGNVTVRSRFGEGSVFSVFLPSAEPG